VEPWEKLIVAPFESVAATGALLQIGVVAVQSVYWFREPAEMPSVWVAT
jgi:hypothetical protein